MKLVFFLESTKRFDDNRKQAKTIGLNYPTQDGIQGLKKIGILHQDSDQTKFGLRVKYTPEIGFNLLKFIPL